MSKQKKGSFFRDVIVVGFALFSMFFGAGNVIFPPYLGMESGQQRGGAASHRSGACRNSDVCHYSVHWAHGGHPPHLRQHL